LQERPEKGKYSRQIGSHPGNRGLEKSETALRPIIREMAAVKSHLL
jgi:hypothetical protein